MCIFIKYIKHITAIFLLSLTLTNPAPACTLALHSDPTQSTMVARNMDWFEDMKSNLYIYPRGISRIGMSSTNPLQWTSKYGSIVTTVYEQAITADGFNEKGLAAHVLALQESDYGQRNIQIPGLSASMWTQYYLDNFQTVDEAVRYTQTNAFQLTPYYLPQAHQYVNLHLALEDATGDSAIIEYIAGTLHIYHNRNDIVLTNSPSYDAQLINLKEYLGFGGNKPLPGTSNPKDRFVRAAYYISHLRKAKSIQDEVAQMLAVMENAGQPYGINNSDTPMISQSIWRTVSDLTHRTYYFTSTTSSNLIWVQLDQFNLRPDAAIMKLDLTQPGLVGDVSKLFKPLLSLYITR